MTVLRVYNCTEVWRTSKDSSWKKKRKKKKKKKTVKIAVSNVQKLQEYMENFGKGVQQRSVRSDSKENAASLPQYLNLY